VRRKKLDSCENVVFKGGQILIHQSKGHTIIEIHAGLGWRMGKFRNAMKVKRGGGKGSVETSARTILRYSKQLYWEDKHNMEGRARKRNMEILGEERC